MSHPAVSASLYASPELASLAACSVRLAADPLVNQAAGGNTSTKLDAVLWVKGSGLWLRDALARPLFVPLDLARLRAGVDAGHADAAGPALRADLATPGLRPSIEATLHGLMPHRVVLHVHAVDAVVWSVRPDARECLPTLLAGERWAWVPYVRPGLPLTQAVARVLAEAPVDVLVMQNHGLVVGGDDADDAQARLARACAALAQPVRPAPGPADELSELAAGLGWRLPDAPQDHALATDPLNLARARRGVLYPDHVVFLGTELATAPDGLDRAGLRAWLEAQQRAEPQPPCVALPGLGVLVRADLDEASRAMLTCWADVLQRLPEQTEPVYLPMEEALALANWEAEKFRRQLSR